MNTQSSDQFFGASASASPQTMPATPSAPQPTPQTLPQPAAPGVSTSLSSSQFFSGQGTNNPVEPGFFSNLASGNVLGAAKNAMDFAFPIISDLGNDVIGKNQKTALQQLGDLGLSALWFIPGFGEAGEAAIRGGELAAEVGGETLAHEAPGLLSKVIGSNVAKGAAIGYAGDVSSKLASGQTDPGSILSPGLGTVTGGIAGSIFPKLSKMLGQNFTQEGALQSLQDNMESAFRGTKTGTQFLSGAEAAGHTPSALLANEMAIPDIVDGKFSTTAAQKVVQDNISALGKFRASALDSMSGSGELRYGVSSPELEQVRSELIAKADKQFLGTAQDDIKAHINSEFDAYKKQFGEDPTVSNWEKIKEDFQGKSNYDATRPGVVTQANKMAGNHLKTMIEDLSEKAGFPEMKAYNQLIAQHYTALDGLNLLDGNSVKGGRLGNMLRGHTVAGISAVAGGAMGGGFLGTLAAGAAGEAGSALYSKILGDMSIINPWQEKLLNKIATENPSVVQKLQALMGTAGEIAPQLAPKSSKALTEAASALTKITAREAAQAANPIPKNINGHTPGEQVKGGDGNLYQVNEKGNYVLVQ